MRDGRGLRDSPPEAAIASRIPPPEPFELLARLDDIPDGGLLGVVKASGERVCLVRLSGEVYAVSDNCTHQGFAMSDGTLLPNGVLECAWHGATFDCRTGAASGLPAEEPLPAFEVRVEGDRVYVGGRKS
jgi:3-phenylpropionate/trans-cinnamate dioxygenase ferredoxin subunit